MSFTVALCLLAAGFALGLRLFKPLARMRQALARRRYRAVLLQPCSFGEPSASHPQDQA